MYRVLEEKGLKTHRGPVKARTNNRPKARAATGPNQLLCWDITYLPAAVRGTFFYLYVFLDVWSRKIVSWGVHEEESEEHAAELLAATCNAHGRRKFRDAEATQPGLAKEGGAFLGAIYGEEEKAQVLGLAGEALREHRQRYIRPIADKFEVWLAAVEPVLLPSEPLMTAVRYYKNHRDALFRFMDDPDVPIDNSPTEREFRSVAKLRLNMLFAGSAEGAHRACVLLGIVATCRANRVPVQAYLVWAFERLGTHRDVFGLDMADITPAAFKRSATSVPGRQRVADQARTG